MLELSHAHSLNKADLTSQAKWSGCDQDILLIQVTQPGTETQAKAEVRVLLVPASQPSAPPMLPFPSSSSSSFSSAFFKTYFKTPLSPKQLFLNKPPLTVATPPLHSHVRATSECQPFLTLTFKRVFPFQGPPGSRTPIPTRLLVLPQAVTEPPQDLFSEPAPCS